MRTHRQIIRDGGGAQAVHDRLGLSRKVFTVGSWSQRDSIPGEYWQSFATAGLATLEELATAAERRLQRKRQAEVAA